MGLQCPAVGITALKHSGLIARCGCNVAPGRGLCHVHLARLKRGREVLVLDWSDETWVDMIAAEAADLHQARLTKLKAQVEARIAAEVAAISAHLASLHTP